MIDVILYCKWVLLMYDYPASLHPCLLEIIKNTSEDMIAGSLTFLTFLGEQMADKT